MILRSELLLQDRCQETEKGLLTVVLAANGLMIPPYCQLSSSRVPRSAQAPPLSQPYSIRLSTGINLWFT